MIDLIRASDCITPILHTPDVKERMQGIVRTVERLGDWNPNSFLTAPQRWGGFAQSLTWISHYRAFRNGLATGNFAHTRDTVVHKRGCIELAIHLDVTAQTLSTAIKDDFLRLADQWVRTKDRKKIWRPSMGMPSTRHLFCSEMALLSHRKQAGRLFRKMEST